MRRIYNETFQKNIIIGSSSSSSSSSESSAEEQDDAISRDSMEVDQVYLDESVCPIGCDKKLYNLTFDLRNQRHLIEQYIRQAKDDIQALNMEIKSLENNVNKINGTLAVENENLIQFTVIRIRI